MIFDEAGDTNKKRALEASLVKLLLDRRKVIVRPPYAKESGQHAWLKAAMYFLCKTFPRIPEDKKTAHRAWYRRFLVVTMDASFVLNVGEADPNNGVFVMDGDLETFVGSGLFAAMYFKRYFEWYFNWYFGRLDA